MMTDYVGRTHRPVDVGAKLPEIGCSRRLTPAGCGRAAVRGAVTRLGVIAGLAAALSGCVSPVTSHIAPDAGWAPESARVLVMPPDTRIQVVTTGGLYEERADWTQESRANLTAALGEALSARSVQIVPYREFGETIPWDPDHAPMIRLYGAVGDAIRVADQLPTKRRLRGVRGSGLQPGRHGACAGRIVFGRLRAAPARQCQLRFNGAYYRRVDHSRRERRHRG